MTEEGFGSGTAHGRRHQVPGRRAVDVALHRGRHRGCAADKRSRSGGGGFDHQAAYSGGIVQKPLHSKFAIGAIVKEAPLIM